MKSDEYIENVVKDGFERELDVDENVARTLPFFAASLAVAATLYGYIAARLPPLSLSPFSVVLHILLAVAAICAVRILWHLFQAVRAREYLLLSKETEQIEWADALRTHFSAQSLTAATIDKKVTDQLRQRMASEYAKSAEHNREANRAKLQARAAGFTLLVAILAIAFIMIGIIFISEHLAPSSRKDPTDVIAPNAAPGNAPKVGQRSPAAAQGTSGSTGREVLRGSGGEHRDGSGSQVTGSKPATPPSS